MVIARIIEGKFRTRKNQLTLLLFVIFVALPLVKIGGHPAVFLDIPNRMFYIFGLVIWPQELYFLHIILISAGLSLFFFTALLGRVWCAYGCPQTVFTEVYDFVGRLAGGKKYGKKNASLALKIRVHAAWVFTSAATSFLFVSYFAGAEFMAKSMLVGNIFANEVSNRPATWFLFWVASFSFAHVVWTWFRENACNYVCPYGRFQTALLDSHSPIVTYDAKRGEPRRQKGQKKGVSGAGDCTACNMCQLVCPTGIDIREGLQVGCITCGLCVDACTTEMQRDSKATLIDMLSMEQMAERTVKTQFFRPRTVAYGSLLVVAAIVFTILLVRRVPIYTQFLQDKTVDTITIPGMGFQNIYDLRVGNMSFEPLRVKVEFTGEIPEQLRFMNKRDYYDVPAEGFKRYRVLLRYHSQDKPKKQVPFKVKITDVAHPGRFKISSGVFSFPSS